MEERFLFAHMTLSGKLAGCEDLSEPGHETVAALRLRSIGYVYSRQTYQFHRAWSFRETLVLTDHLYQRTQW